MSETEDRRFYVYVHKKATTGEVFYVGKGAKSRATSKQGRNLHWKNTANKHGFTVEKVLDNLTNEQACTEEIKLIAKLREEGISLCNIADGGETGPGLKGKDNPSFDPTIYTFYKYSGTDELGADCYQKVEGTCYDLQQKYGMRFSRLVRGHRNIENGWALTKESAKYCRVRNKEVTLWHPEHGWLSGTRNWFKTNFNLESGFLSLLIQGKEQKAKGFALKEYEPFGKFKGLTVKLYNIKTKEVFTGTRKEFSEKFSIGLASVYALFRNNSRSETCHGWQILKEQ